MSSNQELNRNVVSVVLLFNNVSRPDTPACGEGSVT
jgi:hypothetical protein